MVLLCVSDIHGESAGLKQVVDASPEADVIVIAGDITHMGGYEEAQRILAPLLESGKRVLAVAGNMDGEGARRYIEERGISIHGLGLQIGDVGIQGLGGSNRSPFRTPFELSADDARALLEKGNSGIAARAYKVLVSHAPPKGTKLDRTRVGLHVGSAEVRSFILEMEPNLCISGHIHESSGEDTLGKTLCLNLGPYKDGRYALVTIDGLTTKVIWRNR
jgi:Icc-related predicted phosphoesterase